MVARKFLVHHNDSSFDVEYDTDNGFEVFKFQLFSLTSIPPDQQKILGGDGDDDGVVLDDSDLAKISDKLRVVSIGEECGEEEVKEGSSSSITNAESQMKSDEEFARMLQAEEEALLFQQFIAGEGAQQIEDRVRPYTNQVLKYEDPMRQEAARKTVPVEELEEKALVSLAKEGIFRPSKSEQDHAFLLQLLFWFKQSFRWVNAPPCDSCGSDTVNQGMGAPLPSEIQYGGSRVELYRCKLCSRITRFPRYNDPLKLVETRKGRCGEWANCFTLYCRAFGYESRLILDFTDHVWTECFSHTLGRWMHLDPCEGIYDNPLLYENGWGKKLNYVIAIAKDGVHDVTKRYTRKWHEVLARRNITTENTLATVLTNITNECRRGFTSQMLSVIDNRDKRESEELERCLHSLDENSIVLPGRQSGDKEWRISRSELGHNNCSSITSSSCPSRVCVDEHVTKIYDAFHPILSHLVSNSVSKSCALEVLKVFKGALVDLQRLPFKTRRTSIKSVLNDAQCSMTELLPAFLELLGALSLRSELEADGKLTIYLANEPVKTSLALPVAVDAIDYLIHNLNLCQNIDRDSLSLPLLKLNRICSGTVLASGEELPVGIATSAFDGLRLSKWEEPNGARGSWIIYKVKANQLHEVVAYELMSANDAPERDPMDWVLEGSDNEGTSWQVLDKQTSQLFDDRFQHKTYIVKSEPFCANVFRFRFLSVRDVDSTSRLQIGNIALYARKATLQTV